MLAGMPFDLFDPADDPGAIASPPAEWLRSIGEVFAEFGAGTQDSGNISYGLSVAGRKCFVKTAGLPDDPVPYLKHDQRVRLLRNAVDLSRGCGHALLPRLHRVLESAHGPLLIYEWIDGDLLRRANLERFKRLPAERILTALDGIVDLHRCLAESGWVAEDFYDGCLLYDFDRHRLRVMDLDSYHRGPIANPGHRFGSDRFKAPEESEPGAIIDQRSTVYTLGRTAAVLLSDNTLRREAFRGDERLRSVASRACERERERRYQDVGEFARAWAEARLGG
jgi:serine/threonine-protein kinase